MPIATKLQIGRHLQLYSSFGGNFNDLLRQFGSELHKYPLYNFMLFALFIVFIK
ncbi:MAG: hypothetical protein KGZ62_06150 [Sulfurimonas sp.]|nr:hypothetical protein [Sulfurimonas sp.]